MKQAQDSSAMVYRFSAEEMHLLSKKIIAVERVTGNSHHFFALYPHCSLRIGFRTLLHVCISLAQNSLYFN